MKRRNAVEGFGLSFLDVICCGFGAVILLLIITKTVEPNLLGQQTAALENDFSTLRATLLALQNDNATLQSQVDQWQSRNNTINAQLKAIEQSLANAEATANTRNIEDKSQQAISGKLEQAKQQLTAEMRRLQARQKTQNSLIGGIPVDSEYLVFIIDTSGSMYSNAWPRMLREFEATLNIYPKVKGIQVINDMGQYLFRQYRGRWIPDTPAMRRIILQQLRSWNVFSNSSPVEGIAEAIRTFYDTDKKISLYVFGDEFSGDSIAQVVRSVDKLNPKNKRGEARVRIHAVGFPVQFSSNGGAHGTGVRFATLMRELAWRNGGTFVGLSSAK